jgi:hypothetical protein
LHIEPQLREHRKEEPVVLETIAAAPVFDYPVEERRQIKRQVETQSGTDAAERQPRNVAPDQIIQIR